MFPCHDRPNGKPPYLYICMRFDHGTLGDEWDVQTPCAFSEKKIIGLLWYKVRMFCLESTDVSIKEVRCFSFPVSTFFPWETTLRCSPLKKVFEKILHFLHQHPKHPVFTGSFGWRMRCRIGCRIAFQASKGVGLPRYFVEKEPKNGKKWGGIVPKPQRNCTILHGFLVKTRTRPQHTLPFSTEKTMTVRQDFRKTTPFRWKQYPLYINMSVYFSIIASKTCRNNLPYKITP